MVSSQVVGSVRENSQLGEKIDGWIWDIFGTNHHLSVCDIIYSQMLQNSLVFKMPILCLFFKKK